MRAWQDPVFRTYLVAVIGVLAVAGIALAVADRVARGRGKSLAPIWTTYRSWYVLVPAVLLPIALGRSAVILAVTLASVYCFKEFARATGLYEDWGFCGLVYLGIVAVNWAAYDRWSGLFQAMPVYAVGALLILPILRNEFAGMVQRMALSILGFIYFGWFLGHLSYLSNSPHRTGYLLYLVFATELNDVAAFTCGRLFGRHTFTKISPRKTVEGAVGAGVITLILAWPLRFSFPHFGPFQVFVAGLIIALGGLLGDLVISVIKRDIGIKDMGALIPGHGGLLDRLDSLIFVAPLFFRMVNFFYGMD